jgi:hypothetical protein
VRPCGFVEAFLCLKNCIMVVFKVKDSSNGSYVEINFCESGLYIEIGDAETGMESNFIIDKTDVDELIKYLNVN